MKLTISQLAMALMHRTSARQCTGEILANGVIDGSDLGAMPSYMIIRTYINVNFRPLAEQTLLPWDVADECFDRLHTRLQHSMSVSNRI